MSQRLVGGCLPDELVLALSLLPEPAFSKGSRGRIALNRSGTTLQNMRHSISATYSTQSFIEVLWLEAA